MNPRRRLILVAGLAIAGVTLLAVSYRVNPRPPATVLSEATPTPDLAPRPSPTWGAMPTRAAAQVFAPDLQPLRQALLVGDLGAAELMWEALEATEAGDTYEAQLVGARLALQLQDYASAEARAWRAIRLAPQDALGWSLLGVTLRRSGDVAYADHVLEIAETLDPDLSPDLFDERWRIAVARRDGTRLLQLAESYVTHHPDSPLAPHYQGTALLATGEGLGAINVLVEALREDGSAPALVWYTLGEAYLTQNAYREAATCLEVAARKLAAGDSTLRYMTTEPLDMLNERLARAYLFTERCAEAESLFRRLVPLQPELETWIERAVVCQTPTPTLTPWILPPVTLTPSY